MLPMHVGARLYDALYGSDVISSDNGAESGMGYNPVRGAKVVAFAKAFLDEALPLQSGSHANATSYRILGGALAVILKGDQHTTLRQPEKLVGSPRYGHRTDGHRSAQQWLAYRDPDRSDEPDRA